MKLLLAGYFGCGNLGDDAILAGYVHALAGKNHEITALSGDPDATARAFGIAAKNRRSAAEVSAEIARCDALVFPGGSIFQDVTSWRSPLYYARLVSMAKKRGKRVFLVGQGVGPVTTWMGRRLTRQAFQLADAIVVRDPDSEKALRALGVTRNIQLGADSAFLLPPPRESETAGFQVGEMKAVGIAPRPVKGCPQLVETVSDLCRLLHGKGYMPVLIEMDRLHDGPFIAAVEKTLGGKAPSLRKAASPMLVQQRVARMESVIAIRLHAGILAASAGTVPFMVSYDPKVAALANGFGLPYVPINAVTSARALFEAFEGFLSQSASFRPTFEAHLRRSIDLARVNLSPLEGSI